MIDTWQAGLSKTLRDNREMGERRETRCVTCQLPKEKAVSMQCRHTSSAHAPQQADTEGQVSSHQEPAHRHNDISEWGCSSDTWASARRERLHPALRAQELTLHCWKLQYSPFSYLHLFTGVHLEGAFFYWHFKMFCFFFSDAQASLGKFNLVGKKFMTEKFSLNQVLIWGGMSLKMFHFQVLFGHITTFL